MYPPSSSPTQSLSSFILIIASLTVGGLVRLWLSAYLSALASEEEEEEAADGCVCVCVWICSRGAGLAPLAHLLWLYQLDWAYCECLLLQQSSRRSAVRQEWTEHSVPAAPAC